MFCIQPRFANGYDVHDPLVLTMFKSLYAHYCTPTRIPAEFGNILRDSLKGGHHVHEPVVLTMF